MQSDKKNIIISIIILLVAITAWIYAWSITRATVRYIGFDDNGFVASIDTQGGIEENSKLLQAVGIKYIVGQQITKHHTKRVLMLLLPTALFVMAVFSLINGLVECHIKRSSTVGNTDM